MKNSRERNTNKDFRRVVRNTLFMSIIAMALIVITLTTVITERADTTIRTYSKRMLSTNSAQLKMNIESYLEKVESTSALLFADEKCYTYDATKASISDYDKIIYEDAIYDRIVDIGIMENFADFTIVYSDKSHVGWLSNGTKDIFGDELYDVLTDNITNDKKKDGWFDGYEGYYDRMYYVKRLNPNAVLLVSFYSRELEHVFDIPDELKNLTLRLVDEDNNILYSSNRQEIGTVMALEDGSSIDFNGTAYVGDNLISSLVCDNGWKVVCQMSMDVVLQDVAKLRLFTHIFAFAIIVIFSILTVVGMHRMSNPLDKEITKLSERAETDGLSGLYNKVTFENIVKDSLANRSTVAFVMLDMDHFKNVNDTKGHSYGDEVIKRTAKVLKASLREDTLIGRLGGDEFAFMFSDNDYESDVLKAKVIGRLGDIKAAFNEEFQEERKELGLSLSFGAYVDKYNEEEFSAIYERADKALYASKENGRDCYTIYDKTMEVEK